MSVTIASGRRDKRVRLQTAGAAVPDGDGGWTQGLADLVPAIVYAHITTATARELERNAIGTTTATASHVITIPYHKGVTTETQIEYDDQIAGRLRRFLVNGVRNPDEANTILVLTAVELVP